MGAKSIPSLQDEAYTLMEMFCNVLPPEITSKVCALCVFVCVSVSVYVCVSVSVYVCVKCECVFVCVKCECVCVRKV